MYLFFDEVQRMEDAVNLFRDDFDCDIVIVQQG